MLTYQATTEQYEPSDGVSANVGDLDLRNILVISDDGVDGNLLMTAVNSGDDDIELTIEFGGESQTVDIEGGSTVAVGVDDVEGIDVLEPLLLEGIDAEPGSLLPVYFQYGNAEGVEVQVPVLDSRLPEYSDLAP
jgi:hypothetical protein